MIKQGIGGPAAIFYAYAHPSFRINGSPLTLVNMQIIYFQLLHE